MDFRHLSAFWPTVVLLALGLANDADIPLPDRLAAQLAGRAALIVLDNCEHVREGAASLVND